MSKSSRLSPQNAAELYLAYREAEGLRPSTMRKYRDSIAYFLRQPDIPEAVADLSPEHAVRWLATMRDSGRLTAGGISTYQRAVWTWFTWLYQGDMLPVDIARRVKRVKVTNPKRRTASTDAHDKMIVVAANKRENAIRDVAIIELLWASGLRRAECAALQLDDVDVKAGKVLVRSGKGDRRREAAFDAMARIRLVEYLVKVRGYEPGPLFIDRHGEGISTNAIKLMLQRVAANAGVVVASHDLRRAAAARMLREGMAAENVAHLLGHSVEMTTIYGQEGMTERAMREYHARDASYRPLRRDKRA